MVTVEQTDFSSVSAEELAAQKVSWPLVEGASRYVVSIDGATGCRSNRLFYEELSEPSIVLGDIIERGDREPEMEYGVDIFAFTANGRLVNHSSGDNAQALVLPDGWIIRDLYQTPCEKKRAEEE